MASIRVSRGANPLIATILSLRPIVPTASALHRAVRSVHQSTRLPAMAASNPGTRPTLQPLHQPSSMLKPTAIGGTRSIFIQTENTPNPDALKFLPNHQILPANIASPYINYETPRSTITPPHTSPLAASLMSVDGVISVFYGADFITVTKAPDANWAHVKPEVFALITEAVTSGAPIVTLSLDQEGGQVDNVLDSLAYNPDDSEVVSMIKELLESRIRPSVQEDGGDLEFHGFKDGQVFLKLVGACKGCSSSSVTLKSGIEGMLMHYIEEVEGVTQVLDPAEAISNAEFAKFENGLKNKNT